MAPPELPGYYFDPKLQRHFKIMPDHLVYPEHPYSATNVAKKRKEQEKRDRHDQLIRTIRSETAPRSNILGRAISIGLHREHGHTLRRPLQADASAQTYVAGIQRSYNGDITPRDASGFSRHPKPMFSTKTSFFVHDPLTDAWIMGGSTGLNSAKTSIVASPWAKQHRENYSTSAAGIRLIHEDVMRYNAELSSLGLTPSRVQLATTYGAAEPAKLHITRLADPSEFTHLDAYSLRDGVDTFYSLPDNQATCTIWSSAANPFTSMGASVGNTDQIAVGSSKGVSLIDLESGRWTKYRDPGEMDRHKPQDEIWTLSWMSPHVLAGGGKTGRVLLWDTRTSNADFSFMHDHPVSNIKCLPEKGPCVVITGTVNSLDLYDLRFGRQRKSDQSSVQQHSQDTHYVKVPDHRQQLSNFHRERQQGHHGHRQRQYHPNTIQQYRSKRRRRFDTPKIPPKSDHYLQPLLTFDYENIGHKPGMDVYLDVLATGDGDGHIRLYSLVTGALLRTIKPQYPNETANWSSGAAAINCIRFVDEPGIPSHVTPIDEADASYKHGSEIWRRRNLNAGRTALAAGVAGEIVLYAWENENDDEA
ncbi:MAG: hypothetical protein Q9165_000159 [Trypethelium subeluteriae]